MVQDTIGTFMTQWANVLGRDADMLKPDDDHGWVALWRLEQRRLDGEEKSKKDVLAEILEREYAKFLVEQHPKQKQIGRREWLDLVTVGQDGEDQKAVWFFTRMMSSDFPFCSNYGSKSGFYAIDLAADLKLFGTKKKPTIYNYLCRFKNGEYNNVFGEDSADEEEEELEQPPQPQHRRKRGNDLTPKVHDEPRKAKVTKVDNSVTPSMNGGTQRKSIENVSEVTESESEEEEFETIASSTLNGFSRRDLETKVNDMGGEIESLKVNFATLQETVKTMQDIVNKKMKQNEEHITTLHANDKTMQKLLQDIINKTNRRFRAMEDFLKKSP